jgi:hypothetical protein
MKEHFLRGDQLESGCGADQGFFEDEIVGKHISIFHLTEAIRKTIRNSNNG